MPRDKSNFPTENILNEAAKRLEKDHEKDYVSLHYSNRAFVETENDCSSEKIDQETAVQEFPANQESFHAAAEAEKATPILWSQIFGAFSCAFVHLNVGVVIGYTGITLPSMMDPNSEDLILTEFQAAIFSSIVSIGAIFGSVVGGLMAVWLGQKSSLLIWMPITMVSTVCVGLAPGFWLLLIGRLGQGLVLGASSACASTFVVELLHPSVRGRLAALIDLARQLGILFVYLIGSTYLTWRAVAIVCGIVSSVIPFISLIFLPHSPRWLATRGRREDAEKSLTFFRGSKYDVNSELNDIMQQLNNQKGAISISDQLKILRQRKIFKRFIVIFALMFASRFTGNLIIISYTATILEAANISISPYLSSIVLGVTRILGVIIYVLFSDSFRRKFIFMIPLFLAAVCMFILGAYFYAKLVLDVSSISWLPLAALIPFTFFTCISTPVLMLWRSELMPNSVRSLAVGVIQFIFYTSAFLATFSFPYIVRFLGSHWAFWIYGLVSLCMVLIGHLFIPETQGKSLEEIEGR